MAAKDNDGIASLTDTDKGISPSNNELANWFRAVCQTLNVGPVMFMNCMNRYLADPTNGIPQNSKDRLTARGNLTKALFRRVLSWNVFLKGLVVLGIKDVKFIVEVKTMNDDTWRQVELEVRDLPARVSGYARQNSKVFTDEQWAKEQSEDGARTYRPKARAIPVKRYTEDNDIADIYEEALKQ